MIRKFKLSLIVSVLAICLSNVCIDAKQVKGELNYSNDSDITQVQHAMGDLPNIYNVGLQNEYSSDLIKLDFYLSSEFDFNNIYYTNSSVDVLDSLFDVTSRIVTYDIRLLAEESYFTAFADNENYSSVYFAESSDDLFFASPSSLVDATSKMITYEYESEIITYNEYVEIKQQLYSSSVIKPSHMPTTFVSTSPNKISASGTFNWIDDNIDSHPLSYTKVVVTRTYYYHRSLSSIDIIPVDIDNVFYTDMSGYFNFEFKGSPTLNDTSQEQYTSLNPWLFLYPTSRIDVSFRVYASGDNTKVVDSSIIDYFYQSPKELYVPLGSALLFDTDFDMSDELGQAMQISQATIYHDKYATYLNNDNPIAPVIVHYPGLETSCFYNGFGIYIENSIRNYSNLHSYSSWDVIGHEYGHHVQKHFSISQSPGGKHYTNTNHADYLKSLGNSNLVSKTNGVRLAWGEGWPTYFTVTAQDFYSDEISDIAFVGDSSYTAYNGANYSLNDYVYYNTEAKGEADEIAVSKILYKLWSYTNDTYDQLTFSAMTLWHIINKYKTTTLSDFINSCYLYGINRHKLGRLLAKYNVSPTNITITNGNKLDVPPTFSWTGAGGSVYFSNDIFNIYFLNASGTELFRVNYLRSSNYTPTLNEWNMIKGSAGSTYSVYVSGSAIAHFSTGPYYSELFTFNKPSGYANKCIISPTIYYFPQRYYFYDISQQITSSNLSFNTTGLRTGYINDTGISGTGNWHITLSPKREGAGTAYLAYSFTDKVNRIDIDLALWSAAEQLYPANSTARIKYKDSSGIWQTSLDLLNDITLTTNRQLPNTYSVVFPGGTKEFRVIATSPATGTRNKGRIVIGNIVTYQ